MAEWLRSFKYIIARHDGKMGKANRSWDGTLDPSQGGDWLRNG